MNIRNTLLAAGSAIALSALASSASASGIVSANAVASVTVVAPTTLTKTQDMAFGTVVKPSTGTNTIILDTLNGVTKTGAGDGSIVASTTTSAKFNITVVAATNYTTSQTLTFVQPGLLNILASAPVATTGTLGTIPAGGTQEIRFGGQFDMNASTPAQAYTGTLAVTVTYN